MDEHGDPLPGSVSEKIRVNINGVDQAMVIKSKDVSHPVLLYLHGGTPDYFLTQDYPTHLEDAFTVVWWDRRGAGLSYRASTPPATLDQLLDDTRAVTDYLRDRFGQDKIYLMGHSEGTFIGIQAAARWPERYHAYIAVAQIANQRKSEVLAYDYMLERFKAAGDTTMVRKLDAAPATMETGTPDAYLRVRDEAMHRLGVGTMHDMDSVVSGLFLRSLQFREFTLGDKVNLWRGKRAAGVSVVWDEALATDLSTSVPGLAVPAYFLHGVHDYTCSYPLAKGYFARLQAPVKGFYTFERSAHSPNFEEPEKVLRILREDVLAGTNRLADAK